MSKLTQALTDAGYANRLITDRQLARAVGGGDARRYGLVNRALKDGSLTRIRRGLYTLGEPYQKNTLHPFVVAQALMPESYVSFETALSHHGWIPEAVYTTACVSPGRKTLSRETDRFGHFSFHPLAIEPYRFLVSVDRIRIGNGIALLAQPLRALMDLVAYRKVAWSGMGWIEHGLRIEMSKLEALRRADFAALRPVYKHKRVSDFLDELEKAVIDTRSAGKQTRELDR
jgi:hypothetical protein